MNMLEELMMKMIEFDCGDPKRIQHFIKVHSFSKLIGEKEGLDAHTLFVLEAASILHDIGIRVSEEKYGFQNAGTGRSYTCKRNMYFFRI